MFTINPKILLCAFLLMIISMMVNKNTIEYQILHFMILFIFMKDKMYITLGGCNSSMILGDRYTGKTSIFVAALLSNNVVNSLCSVDGLGSKRVFGIYVGIQVNLSKLSKMCSTIASSGIN